MSTPSTVITLYRTPLVYGGNDVMDSAAHAACLASSPKQVVSGCTFQRQEGQLVRVPLSQDKAGMYNYLSYVNNGRTFYAFITGMVYRNDNLTVVKYENDYWHTYVNDIKYNQCYILRMTVPKSEDVFGAFLEPEPIGVSGHKMHSRGGYTVKGERVIIMSTRDTGGQPNTQPNFYNGSYSAAKLYNATPAGAKSFLDFLIENKYEDAVVGIYTMPSALVGTETELTSGKTATLDIPIQLALTNIDGYTPKNKKVYASPYCYLHVSASNGSSRDYRLEYFGNSEIATFRVFGSVGSGGVVAFVPTDYGWAGETAGLGAPILDNAITIDMPTGNWSGNSGAAWWLVNGLSTAIGAVASIGSAAIGGGGIGAASSLLSTGADVVKTAQTVEASSYKMHGTMASGNIGAAIQGLGFTCWLMCPTAEEAQTIDNYFSAFGYAINDIGNPTPNKRAVWDYIQTEGTSCSVAVAPATAEQQINTMLNNGLRVWHSAENFGRLDVENN